jgi:probable F420-dependent oxidoreductase
MSPPFRLDVIGFGSSPSAMQTVARQAQQAGFSGLWLTESAQPVFSMCTAAALATDGLATDGLAIGTGIAVAFARSPMVSAQAAWMLADATGGRFTLGLGTQVRAHVERRYSAAFDHPGPRLKEYVAAVRSIFRAFRRQERLRFDGDFYSFSLLPDMWSPGPMDHDDPPIYLAGVSPWMCRMIGEVADGMHVHPLNTATYLEQVVRPAVAEGEIRAGRRPGQVALACPVMTIVGDSEEELSAQREDVRMRLAFYGSTPGYEVVFDTHGWFGVGERLNQLQRAGDFAGMAATVTDEMVDAFAVTAPWERLGQALIDRYASVASHVICYSASPQWTSVPATLERWSDVARAVATGSPGLPPV